MASAANCSGGDSCYLKKDRQHLQAVLLMTEPVNMRWIGHVARMGERTMYRTLMGIPENTTIKN
jgi:hypothetical protein